MAENELTYMFIDILKSPFYEKMVGSVPSGFTDLVIIGERIEQELKSGKIIGVVAKSRYVKEVH